MAPIKHPSNKVTLEKKRNSHPVLHGAEDWLQKKFIFVLCPHWEIGQCFACVIIRQSENLYTISDSTNPPKDDAWHLSCYQARNGNMIVLFDENIAWNYKKSSIREYGIITPQNMIQIRPKSHYLNIWQYWCCPIFIADYIPIQFRPLDAYCWITPQQAILRVSIVKSSGFITKVGTIFQCKKAMCKTGRDPQHFFIYCA